MPQSTCTEPDCQKPMQARGVCHMHYRRMRIAAGGKLPPIARMNESPCSVEGCDRNARKVGMCANHYARDRYWSGLGYARKTHGPRTASQARRYTVDAWFPGRLCVWCDQPVPQERGKSQYCRSSCQLLRSQNRARGIHKRADLACVRCGHDIDVSLQHSSGRRKRTDTQLCDPCRRSKHTRHRMPIHVIIERDGGICGLCEKPVDVKLPGTHRFGPTVDHIIPFARGGTNDPANLQLAHRSCNSRKGARAA